MSEPLELQIVVQGDPRVNNGWIDIRHDDIVYAHIDMHTKNCEVRIVGYSDDMPAFGIYTTTRSQEIGETAQYTEIVLPQFKGWYIDFIDCARYSVTMVLLPVKDDGQ